MKSLKPLKDSCEIGGEQGIPVEKIKENTQWTKIGIDTAFSPFHGFPIPLNPSPMQPVFDIIFLDETRLDFSLFEPFCNLLRIDQVKKIGARSQIDIDITGDDFHLMKD